MPAPLQLAVVQPPCVTGALAANAEAHALSVLAARARLVVFPELSLTGYDLEARAVAVDEPALSAVVEACATTGTTALGTMVGGTDQTAGRSAIFRRDGSVQAETSALPGGIARALLV